MSGFRIKPHGEKPASNRAEDRIKGKSNMTLKREVIFVIDGSGSMGDKATDVRGGFNTYVEELKKDPNAKDYTISATVFNTGVFPLFTQRSLDEAPLLTEKNYMPGGGTALYDAIADTVDKIKDAKINFCGTCGKKRGNEAHFCATCGDKLTNGDTSAFTVIIMTDGEENSSQRFRKHHIVNKIQGKEKLGNWTFVYMGANQDAMVEGAALGVQRGNSIHYTTHDTKTYYSKLAAGTIGSYNYMASTNTTSTPSFSGISGQDWNDPTTGGTPVVTTVTASTTVSKKKKNA